MKKPEVYKILQHLSKVERNRFHQFLDSPYFNRREDLIQLFRAFDQHIRDGEQWEAIDLSFLNISNKNDGLSNQWYKRCSLLQKLLEQFLILDRQPKSTTEHKVRLASVYRELGLRKAAQKALREAKRTLEQAPFQDAYHFQKAFTYYQEEFAKASKEQRLGQNFLNQLNQSLDHSFILYKLRYACISLTDKTLNPKEDDAGFLPYLLEYLEQSNMLNNQAIRLYFDCYQMLSKGALAHFEKVHQQLLHQPQLLPAEEWRDLFLMSINYCIKQLNSGAKGLSGPGLSLFKKGLEENWLLSDGKLSRYTYYNCFVMAISAREHHWAAQFLKEYQPLLPVSHRQTLFNFCTMRLAYEQKDYDQALKLLRFLDYPDMLFQLSARIIQLKIYHEIDEFDLLQSQLDALRTFLQRKKVMGYHKQNYMNFIKYLRKITAVNPFDKTAREHLKKEIIAEPVLTEREWLLGSFNNE